MNESTQFCKGRLSIIKELKTLCESKLNRLSKEGNDTDTHKRATKGGLKRAYSQLMVTLQQKEASTMANDLIKQRKL